MIKKFIMTFNDFDLTEPILNALKSEGYTVPTPIQIKAIPIVIKGQDLLACAQTGTGKTAAFAVPILRRLEMMATNSHTKPVLKTLVLTPTRELAIQIADSFEAYGKNSKQKVTTIFGGVSQLSQVQAIKKGTDILVATPGRLLDLIQQGIISLSTIEIFVLDEADRMLDMGFVHDIKRIIKLLPQKRQSLFFSATIPPNIHELAYSILTNPVKVEVTPVSSTAETIQQELIYVQKDDKYNLLLRTLQERDGQNALIFTRTKHGADKVVKVLSRNHIMSAAIHGNKSQNARQKALNDFKENINKVLVATDIAARGIDIDELSLVINFEIPNIPETYVHRIGRTGRAGASGCAISFCDQEERAYIRDIQKLINIQIPAKTFSGTEIENIAATKEIPVKVLETIEKGHPKSATKKKFFWQNKKKNRQQTSN
jgi:ATP-dependent RNA helicase RhlE